MLSPPKPLPTHERVLIEAWHSPNSTAAIAADLGIRGSELDLAFRALKREGKLPRCSRQQAQQRAESMAPNDRPGADEDASAKLLERLIRVHGGDNETGMRENLYPGCKRR